MSQIIYINILVDWSLSGIMTSKLVIRESESPWPAASSILISRMKSILSEMHYSEIYCTKDSLSKNVFFIWINSWQINKGRQSSQNISK